MKNSFGKKRIIESPLEEALSDKSNATADSAGPIARTRRAPPPPKPGAGMRLSPPSSSPIVKPRPLDVLNRDISNSRPLSAPQMRGVGKSNGKQDSVELVPSSNRDVTQVEISHYDSANTTPVVVDDERVLEKPKQRSKFGSGNATTAAPKVEEKTAKGYDTNYYNLKSQIFNALIDAMDLVRVVAMPREEAEAEITTIVDEIISVKGHVMSISEQKRLVDDICDDILGYGPLEPLLARDDIADIMVNGAEQVFIETDGKIELTNIRFKDNAQLLEICQRIVSKVGRRVDESSPICDARLLDGSRVNVIVPPLAIDGATLTIRKFKKDKLKMSDLVRFGAMSPEGAKVMEIAANARCNILISGGTGSGKTTLLNCLSSFADDDERIITCEDSAELQLQQPHVVRLETRPPNLEGQGEVSMRDLVKNCLRMRPERIIVGEVRGPEAFDLLQAMNTGHDGSMGTLHANSPRECLSRLESMITMGGFSLPSRTIREMVCSAVNVIVQAQRLRDGSRRITHVTEVLGMEGDTIITQDLLTYKITGEDAKGKLTGRHVSTGIGRPAFYERAKMFNRDVELQDALASMEEVL